jgi:hypothetical protein
VRTRSRLRDWPSSSGDSDTLSSDADPRENIEASRLP